MTRKIFRHQDLIVYKRSIDAAMTIFELSRRFPRREVLADGSSPAFITFGPANIAESWRKRRYSAAFVAKITDAEAEAAETQTWIEIAFRCGYLFRDTAKDLYSEYEQILAMLSAMENRPENWIISKLRP